MGTSFECDSHGDSAHKYGTRCGSNQAGMIGAGTHHLWDSTMCGIQCSMCGLGTQCEDVVRRGSTHLSGADHMWGGTHCLVSIQGCGDGTPGDGTLSVGGGVYHARDQEAGAYSEDGTPGDSTQHGPPSLGHSVVPTVRATMPGSIPHGTQCIECGSLPGSHIKAAE